MALADESCSIVVFDNWRVLHGRSAFTGVRRICGGYSKIIWSRVLVLELIIRTVNHDDFVSRFKMVSRGRENVLQEVSRG